MDVLVPVPSEGLEEVVYAGTPQGVFVSRDGTSSWAPCERRPPGQSRHQSHRRVPCLPRGRDSDCRPVRRPVQERRPGHDLDKRQQRLPRRLPCRISRRLLPRLRHRLHGLRHRYRAQDRLLPLRRGDLPLDRRRGDLDASLRGQSGHIPRNQDGHIAGFRPRRHPVRVHLRGFAPLSG